MAFPYTPPVFNIIANVWRSTSSTSDPPDLTPDAQLYVNSRMVIPLTPGDDNVYVPCIELRVPVGTDLRDGDQVEAAAGDGWFYRVRWTERVHLGFSNEYFIGLLEQTTIGPPTVASILLETGEHVLTELGDLVLVE